MNTLAVVRTALEQKSLSGIVDILATVGREMYADGCVLWEASPTAQLDGSNPSGSLFVLAQWFKRERVQAAYNLDVNTPIGRSVAERRTYTCKDCLMESGHTATYPFTLDQGLRTLCAVPITFKDCARGALAVYWERDVVNLAMRSHLEEVARLFPDLYSSLRNRISLSLVQSVTNVIQKAEREADHILSSDEVKETCRSVAQSAADAFGCIETSIYLEEDPKENPGSYVLQASTLDKQHLRLSYRAQRDDGLTGWLLATGKPRRIFDLSDLRELKQRDPELADVQWADSMNIREFARVQLKLPREARIPPLSWMGTPILSGTRLLGAIRCCISRSGPFYFADRELELLNIVAAYIGQFWANWLHRHAMRRENAEWRDVVSGVAQANIEVKKAFPRLARAANGGTIPWSDLNGLFSRIESIPQPEITVVAVSDSGSSTATVASPEGQSPLDTMRQMLRSQIELYGDLARAQAKIEQAARAQTQIYLDMAHQLKTPILSAYRRADQALKAGASGEQRATLLKLRGLCAKARTVTMSVKLFADLAEKQKLEAKVSRLMPMDLQKLLIECASDTEAALEPGRELKVSVDRKGIETLQSRPVMADRDLLEQALSNLLDNASKYSKNGTTIAVWAGITGSGMFHVTVANKPFFRPGSPSEWVKRGWRGEEAQAVTAEGSGIGLYIVNSIMEAHDGRLTIQPWNSDEMTEVKLIFPILGG